MTVLQDFRQDLVRVAAAHTSPAPRRRRRVLGLPIAAFATLSVAAGATATGLVVSQATKEQSAQLTRDASLSENDPGPSAKVGSELEDQSTNIKNQLPYPPGTRDSYSTANHDKAATLGSGTETKRETSLVLEYRAACLWRIYFLDAVDSGNSAAQADALSILRQVPNWPATRTSFQAEMQRGFANDAAAGKLDTLRRDVDVNCRTVK